MISIFSTQSQKSVHKRCVRDEGTKLRLKYAPWYHTFEKQVGSHVWLDGRELILLSSNDYLGLGNHPKVVEASKKAIDNWGTSPTGARIANGSRKYHIELEEAMARFLGKEACHISVAGYISCMSATSCLAQRGDVALIDKNVHSCLWDGIRLSGASMERFAHNKPADLSEVCAMTRTTPNRLLIIEGVYSMEGHICPLPEFCQISQEEDLFIILDDAHGFGVLGEQGRGTSSHFGLTDEVDVIVGSLSKSLSSTGGFLAGKKEVVEYIRTYSKQTIFSAALSPAQAASAQASLEILQTEPEHMERLWSNTRRYKSILRELNLNIWESETPAVPIVLGSKERAFHFWQNLMKKGVFTVMSIAPGVPPGKDMVRTAVSARHTDEDLDRIADAMAYAAKKL